LPSWLTRDYSSSSNLRIGKGRFYYGWVVLAACLIILATSYGIRFSFGVFFKSLEQEFGWTRALTSEVFSVYMLLCPVFAIVGGWAVDRYGAKVVVIVLGFFISLSLVLTSRASAPWHLFVSYSLLLAIGTGSVYAITMSMASRWFIKGRGLAVAVVGVGVGLGAILIAPIATYLIASYGWRISYLPIAFMALFIMVPFSLFLKRSPSDIAASARDGKREAVNLNYTEGQNSDELKEFTPLEAAKTRNFWLLISTWFCYSFCLFMVMTHIVPHAIDLGISPMQAASILSVIGFASIPSRILAGIASDRFGKKRVAMISALFMAGAMLWLAESTSLWMLYLFAVVFGAAYAGLSPPTTAIVGDTFGLHHIGAILGVLEIGWATGAAAGPALAGHIFDITGTYYLAFLLGMIAALIITGLVLFLSIPTAKTRSEAI